MGQPLSDDESRALAEEQAALRRVATLVARGTPPEELFAAVTEEIGGLLPVDYAYVGRYEPDGEHTMVGAWGKHKHVPVGSRDAVGGNNLITTVFETGRSARMDGYADASGALGIAARDGGVRSAVATPILVEGRIWGIAIAGSRREQPLPADTEARLGSFTELVATSIANAESRADLACLAEEQAALHRVATLVARGVAPEEVFAAVTEEVARLLAVDYAHMGRYEGDGTITFIATWDRAAERFSLGSRFPLGRSNLSTAVFDTGRPVRFTTYEDATGPLGVSARETGLRSAVGTPIMVEGAVWGVIAVASLQDEPLPADTEARLGSFTELVATAIANAESRADLARLAEEQTALRRVATLVARGVAPEEVFAAVTEEVGSLLPVDFAILGRYEDDGTGVVLATWGAAAVRFSVGSRWHLAGTNLATVVFETGRPARNDRYAEASGPIGLTGRESGFRSGVGTPITVERRLWGVIVVGSTREQPLPPDTEERLGQFTELLAMAIANAQSRAALRPVERMRVLAERITDRELSERLPVPEGANEVAALGRTLNAMLDRVEAAVARERRVVSDASHELRTPLTTLRAEVDLALMGDRDKAELRAALESASDEAKRMTRLADDLLVLARADQGHLPLRPRPVAARELLVNAVGRARAGAEVRGRSITLGDVADDCAVRADADRAAQALDNLITNALLYGDGTITLSARTSSEYVELHVTDEGDGFSAELLPRAFERFGRGQHARASEPGSGLGLALVQAVAAAHGGRAEVRNRPEGGADVSITLPRA
jgi:signal transduction histidine kinase/putative methionine-R-sulfoxide reductase with GAF domain/uncharacterized protein YoaH (UPF0181 family)